MSGVLEVHHHSGRGDDCVEQQPVFLYDLASPDCYLAAERLVDVLGVVPEWEPVLLDDMPGAVSLEAFRCGHERDVYLLERERRATAQGLPPIRWPVGWPPDSRLAMLVATYAKQIGRAVAYSLAAFRQAYTAGRGLTDPDTVVIAAAACEMHPAAVLKAADLGTVARELARASAAAAQAGVSELPALRCGGEVFQGPDAPEQAAAAVARA